MYSFKFADIGEGIHEGVIHQWLVNEGDTVKDGQTLFMVETDKVTAEIPSPVDGVVAKINFKVGDTIHVGEVAVVIDDGSGGQVEEQPAEKPAERSAERTTESVEEQGSTSVVGEIEVSSELIPSSDEGQSESAKQQSNKRALATPVARKMAKDLGVDINAVTGTGPQGRVMKADIQKAADNKSNDAPTASSQPQQAAQPIAVAGSVERIKLTQMRKTIAKNMVKSKFTIPHTAAMDEVDVSALVAYRKQLNEKLAPKEIKLTFMPFIIKAVAVALKKHPIINASLDESSDEIVIKHDINIGMATDTEDGLTVPVLKAADKLSVLALAELIAQKAEAARNHALTMDDLTDGTFSITNYGSIGTRFGVPVIKYPEAAILGIGTIYKKPAVGKDGNVEIQDTLPLSMSFDHRIIDGADAGRFINTLKAVLADPDLLLIS